MPSRFRLWKPRLFVVAICASAPTMYMNVRIHMQLHLHMQTHGRIPIQLRMYTDVCAPNHTCGPFNTRARTENTPTCACTHVVGVRLVESRVAGTLCSMCVYMHPYMCDLIIFSAVQFVRSGGACYVVFFCASDRGV